MINTNSFKYLLLVFTMVVINSCQQKKQSSNKSKEELAKEERENNSKPDGTNNKTDSTKKSTMDCDAGLWKFVYDPERLQVLDKCKMVAGTIEESNADEDGDQHMLLKLDKEYENLLTERNIKKKQGDLVIEAVCINNITRKKAIGACNGYVNNIELPKVGEYVRVTGRYVIDSHNGWSEIHPISSIEVINK